MKHGSLFSGIGGFDLSAEWMGWTNVFHCEKEPFCQKVLKYYWPDAELFEDITKADFTKYANKIDILTGGFPCQPYSTAGKRLGKEDERHLWPEMLRAIREIRPRWIVGENVRGFTNWNGGLVFDEVQADLEAEGYETLPFLLPACAVNAPHRRERIWIIAYNNQRNRKEERFQTGRQIDVDIFKRKWDAANTGLQRSSEPEQQPMGFEQLCESGPDSDANGIRLRGQINRVGKPGQPNQKSQVNDWKNFPTQSPFCSGNDGFSSFMDSDAFFKELGIEHPRQPAIGFRKWRNESIKAPGNAVVPQVVFEIFKAISLFNDDAA